MVLKKVVLASGNPGKLKEFSAILSAAGIQMVSQADLGVEDCPEPYATFVENALAKARHASRQTGLPALADDSGLCVDALGGAPGVYSARYASLNTGEQGDAANIGYLLQQLQGHTQRQAQFVTTLVYLRSVDDPHPVICDGIWRGEITQQPSGAGGFGYDPVFYVPELGKTAAELTPQLKNRYSHRAQALRQLVQRLA